MKLQFDAKATNVPYARKYAIKNFHKFRSDLISFKDYFGLNFSASAPFEGGDLGFALIAKKIKIKRENPAIQ